MEENKSLQIRLQSSGFWGAIKLCIISVKIYAAIMVIVTFEIKSNIKFE